MDIRVAVGSDLLKLWFGPILKLSGVGEVEEVDVLKERGRGTLQLLKCRTSHAERDCLKGKHRYHS